MGWNDFWKTKDERDFEEFLTNPKEVYQKLQATFQELNASIALKDARIKELEDEAEQNSKDFDELYDHRDKLQAELKDIKEQLENVSEAAALTLDEDLKKEKALLKKEFDMKVSQKNAELEKAYHHEVHTFLEKQAENNADTIALVIKEVFKGIKQNEIKQ